MCFITREIRPVSEWGKNRLRLEPRKKFEFDHPDETSYLSANRKLEITRTVTAKYQKAVEVQFLTMLRNIVGGSKFRAVA